MTEQSTNAAEPAAQERDTARTSPGEYLRKLREEKGHTHAAVGTALHLTVHYVKALEGDDYGKLPGLTFVKGYLRSYARFLGADVDNVLARFDEHIAGLLDAGLHTARVNRSRQRQDQALRWAIGAGLVVVAGIAAGWWYMSGDSPVVSEPAAVVAPPPAAEPPATRGIASASNDVIAAQAAGGNIPQVTQPPGVMLPGLAATPPGPQDLAARMADSAVIAAGVAVAEGLASTTDAPTTSVSSQPNDTTSSASGNAASPANGNVASAPGALSPANAPAASTNAALTITADAEGARQVSLVGSGDDELRVSFNGSSWIEVDDGRMVRLYNDMLSAGDTLTIRGVAPFRVLLGNATQVDMSLNAAVVDFSAEIRGDNTARVIIDAPAGGAPL
jgi:cytoskeleton protein RodZ